jgi:hypothetical protein
LFGYVIRWGIDVTDEEGAFPKPFGIKHLLGWSTEDSDDGLILEPSEQLKALIQSKGTAVDAIPITESMLKFNKTGPMQFHINKRRTLPRKPEGITIGLTTQSLRFRILGPWTIYHHPQFFRKGRSKPDALCLLGS